MRHHNDDRRPRQDEQRQTSTSSPPRCRSSSRCRSLYCHEWNDSGMATTDGRFGTTSHTSVRTR